MHLLVGSFLLTPYKYLVLSTPKFMYLYNTYRLSQL